MKTKIIYISGNELFDMADIRAAFEEVRTALSLGSDTVLFGVPVDNDDALSVSQPIHEHVAESIHEQIDTPVEKPKKTTTHKTKVVPISDTATSTENVETPTEKSEVEPAPSVVPILSVLGSKSDDEESNLNDSTPVDEVVDDESNTETVTITDMIADEAPVQEPEKTLEELLESMTPLGEDADKPNDTTPILNTEENAIADKKSEPDDTDITLEKLANEFVANQDKIDMPTKPSTRGKIGKLKNILPFKKVKHDDSGLMGDLFGWAGVAANDEEFTIPGFFTNVASKK